MKDTTKPFHLKLKVIIPTLLLVTAIIILAAAAVFFLLDRNDAGVPTNNSSVNSTASTPEHQPNSTEKNRLNNFNGISAAPGVDFITEGMTFDEAIADSKKLIDTVKNDGFNTVELTLNYKNGLIINNEEFPSEYSNLLKEFYTYAKSQNISVITTINIHSLTKNGISDADSIEKIATVLSSDDIKNYSDAVLFKNLYIQPKELPEDTTELELLSTVSVTAKRLYEAVAVADPTLYTGVEINTTTMPEDALCNVQQWFNGKFIDYVVIFNPYSTENDDMSFMTYFEDWRSQFKEGTDIFCKLDYSKIGSKEKGWEMTDQILRQLQTLKSLNVNSYILDSYNDYSNDKTESRDAVIKFMQDKWSDNYILKELTVSQPEKTTFKTSEGAILLAGGSDPSFKLTLNGKEVERSDMGYFSLDLKLNLGLNTFTLEHKGVTKTYKITYDRTIIKSFFPSEKVKLPSESTIIVTCTAVPNSKVTASLGEALVTLTEEPIFDGNGILDEEFSLYKGTIVLPRITEEDVNYGKITFTAQSEYGTVTKKSGTITIEKEPEPTPSTPSTGASTNSSTVSGTGGNSNTTSSTTSIPSAGAPSGGDAWTKPSTGKYVSVGSTYVAEVVNWQAETFSYSDLNDLSRPINNYLPKGTVDYCSNSPIYSSGGYMKVLRYGNMLYTTSSKGVVNINVYKGTLPDHNTIGVAGVTNTGRHTQIVLDTLWKAPFRFDLKPQSYKNESASNRDYTITSATYSYIDITFCYTTLVAGDVVIPESDPVFKSAEWIKNEGDYTLRLHLKKTGKFYGWSAEYNNAGQLVFSFLNPAKITAANNAYGYRLDGVVIAIDVGHGGNDIGAPGSNKNYHESHLNLILANKLKAELESLGAKVYMTRYDNNSNPSSDQRMKLLRDYKVDYCIAIHRNSSDSSSPRAFNSYHFNAYSSDAAKLIYKHTNEYTSDALTSIYNGSNPFHGEGKLYKETKWSGTKWHMFYTARQSDCPVVLTENGFISNAAEYSDMIRDDFNNECAKALTKGIVAYFVSIQ